MSTESTHPKLLAEEKSSASLKLLAGGLAVLVTALLLVGYTYFRNRQAAEQSSAATARVQPNSASVPRGPAKAHILVDDAMLKGGQTTIGGTVKNISQEKLTGLSVELDLQRRKDGKTERKAIPLTPADLQPEEEGRYSVSLRAQDYGSVRLVGLKEGADSGLLAYTTAEGQKRPPERLQPRVITIPRPAPGKGEFLNSPENPARVP